jgi:hypothetical protein
MSILFLQALPVFFIYFSKNAGTACKNRCSLGSTEAELPRPLYFYRLGLFFSFIFQKTQAQPARIDAA